MLNSALDKFKLEKMIGDQKVLSDTKGYGNRIMVQSDGGVKDNRQESHTSRPYSVTQHQVQNIKQLAFDPIGASSERQDRGQGEKVRWRSRRTTRTRHLENSDA